MSQTASRFRALLALGVVLVPLLLAGATVVHTHDGAGIGLYNQEHDLVLMGALVVATGVLGWLAAERGRRLASLERPGGRPVAVRAAKVRRADVDSKAV